MAIKALKKRGKKTVGVRKKDIKETENKIKKFIAKGGAVSEQLQDLQEGDHRLTLRIPTWLMDKVDVARKKRVGKISRNLLILEIIEKCTSE